MLMQNFGATNKEHYGMFWYFLEWSITFRSGEDGNKQKSSAEKYPLTLF